MYTVMVGGAEVKLVCSVAAQEKCCTLVLLLWAARTGPGLQMDGMGACSLHCRQRGAVYEALALARVRGRWMPCPFSAARIQTVMRKMRNAG